MGPETGAKDSAPPRAAHDSARIPRDLAKSVVPAPARGVRLGRVLLVLETSTAETVLALADGGVIVASNTARATGRHEDTLLPALDALLGSIGAVKSGLRHIAVGIGPGGFTSLRVGIATAKGLALGLDTSLVGVCSLRTLARGACPTDGLVVVVQDARRGEVHAAVYAIDGSGSTALLEPMHGHVSEAMKLARAAVAAHGAVPIVVGDGARAYASELDVLGDHRLAPIAFDRPQPSAMVVESFEAIAREEFAALDALEPLYVKPSDIKLPAVKLRTSLGDG